MGTCHFAVFHASTTNASNHMVASTMYNNASIWGALPFHQVPDLINLESASSVHVA